MKNVSTFEELLVHLYEKRFTGTLTLDFLNGRARSFSLPAQRVSFAAPVSSKKVDKDAKVADAVTV